MYTDIEKSISTRYTTWFYKKKEMKKILIVLFFIDLSHFPPSTTVFLAKKFKRNGTSQTGLSPRKRVVSKWINYKTIPIVERNLSAFVAATSL